MKEGLEKGREEGLKEKEEMALRMRARFSVEDISMATGLSIEYIEDLFKRTDIH